MFASRYYADRMFAPRYYAKVGANPPIGAGGGGMLLTGVGCLLILLLF